MTALEDSASEELTACQKERDEYLEGWKRAKADLINEKKKFGDTLLRAQDMALDECVFRLLPLADAVEAAVSALPNEQTPWRAGLEQLRAQCQQTFSELGITFLNPHGEPFDPNRHESVGEETTSEKEKDGTIAAVVRFGAARGNRVIRPPMVRVTVYKYE